MTPPSTEFAGPNPVAALDVTREIREFTPSLFVNVFQTMLSMEAALIPPLADPVAHGERVTGTVGFAGETVAGAVYLHFPPRLAVRAAAAMLGTSPDAPPGEAEINDLVGELTNMLCGGLKSKLSDLGVPCAMSTPAIIRGASFQVEPSQGVEPVIFCFDCGGDHAHFEVHVEFR
jgi:chemotaxis protein CheX